jgi:hypothetical protein
MDTRHARLLVALSISSLLVALIAVGGLAWVVTSPETWFPDAFAERGDQGPRGPRGLVGPPGPPGPVGPDAESAIADVSSSVDDLSSRVDDLESQSYTDDLDSRVSDVEDAISSMCQQFLLSDLAPLNDIYYYGGC